MKKFLFSIVVILQFLFLGCVQESTSKYPNKQQQDFDNFLVKEYKELNGQVNDIQRKECYKQYEKELFEYLDSTGLFVNWKGVISDIETDESGKTTVLNFKVEYSFDKNRVVELHCTHLVLSDSLATDYLYNTVKNMPNYMVVYFDGFIRTYNSNKVYYHWDATYDRINISDPDYKFWITDISPEIRKDSLSADMQNTVDISYTLNRIMKSKYLGEIAEKDGTKQFDNLMPSFSEAKSKLSSSEKLYIDRLNTALTYNYLYGGKKQVE